MSFDLPRNVMFQIDEVVLRLDAGRHPYEAGNLAAIAANWEAEKSANPSLFDGEVVLLSQMAYAGRRVEARCHAVRYSTFLHWRRHRPPGSGEHLFAHAMPVTRDNALIAARMRANTANPGQVYFAAGSFEPSDFRDGVADIDFNMTREVREETGLDLGPLRRDPGYHAFSGARGTVVVRRFHLDEDADIVADRIARFVAGESDPEIEGPVVIRGPGDLPRGLAGHMGPLIDWHFSAQV